MADLMGRKEGKMDKDCKMDLLDSDIIVCCNHDVGRLDVPGGRIV